MASDRQRKLFRRGKQPPAPEQGLGREPPRLSFGEPESLAYKRAREAELDRERRGSSDRRRREDASRERQRRIEVETPDPQEVVRALREELTRDDVGMPPRRERIELHALDELAARYPSVPRQYVHEVLSRARSAGLVTYQGRSWSWRGDGGAAPREAAAARLAARVATHTVVLRPLRSREPSGCGTLVGVGGTLGVLTSRAVWEQARGAARPLELLFSDQRGITVDLELFDPTVLGEGLVPLTGIGPDLALLRLPGMLRRPLLDAEKLPYALDEDAGLPLGADVLHGVADGVPGAPGIVVVELVARHRSAVRPWSQGPPLEIEHVDVTGPWSPAMAGAGLWAVVLDAAGEIVGAPLLEGVALTSREGGSVRCHGRASIDDLVRLVRPVRS